MLPGDLISSDLVEVGWSDDGIRNESKRLCRFNSNRFANLNVEQGCAPHNLIKFKRGGGLLGSIASIVLWWSSEYMGGERRAKASWVLVPPCRCVVESFQ